MGPFVPSVRFLSGEYATFGGGCNRDIDNRSGHWSEDKLIVAKILSRKPRKDARDNGPKLR